jgi:hypothetical protein
MTGRPALPSVLLSAVAAGLAAGAAFAALPPEVYAQARVDAPHHVQLRIERVTGLPWHQDHGACEVRGDVVRVFKGDIAEGDELTLRIDCAKPRARLPNGGALWTSWRALEEARVVEAYLGADKAVASWQTVLLSEPSDEPACTEEQEGSC